MGLFDDGKLVHGYSQTPYHVSFGHYKPDTTTGSCDNNATSLTGHGFRLDLLGTLMLGDFQDGTLNGIGLINTSEKLFFGRFIRSDLVHGLVTPINSTKLHYGRFRDNVPHGRGVQFDSGLITQGIWHHGKLDEIIGIFRTDVFYGYNQTTSIDDRRTASQGGLCDLYERLQTLIDCDDSSDDGSNMITSSSHVHEQLLRVKSILVDWVEQYPSCYDPKTWNYPCQEYDSLLFYGNGSAYLPHKNSKRATYMFPPDERYSHFIGIVDPDGVFLGKGLLYTTAGDRISATWNGGKLTTNQKVSIRYKNRDKFTGLVDGNLYPFYGNLVSPCGQIYSGDIHNHKMHGTGMLICRTGAVIHGNWIKGHIHGPNIRVHRPGQWTGILSYDKGIVRGMAYIMMESGRLYKTYFDHGTITNKCLVRNTFLSCYLLTVKRDLIEHSRRILRECGQHIDSAEQFQFKVSLLSSDEIIVDIDYKLSESVRKYFVQLSRYYSNSSGNNNTTPVVFKSDVRRFIITGLEPSTEYSILAGIVRKKSLVPLGKGRVTTGVRTGSTYRSLSKLHILEPHEVHLALREYKASSGKVRLYSIDDFHSFVQDTLQCNCKVGYHERTSTFIMVM